MGIRGPLAPLQPCEVFRTSSNGRRISILSSCARWTGCIWCAVASETERCPMESYVDVSIQSITYVPLERHPPEFHPSSAYQAKANKLCEDAEYVKSIVFSFLDTDGYVTNVQPILLDQITLHRSIRPDSDLFQFPTNSLTHHTKASNSLG
jgi:hypothetical protein